jgi:iron complex outermembrane recepter protein
MFNKKFVLFIVILFALSKCDAQNCNLSIKGHVIDEVSELPLSFVNIFIQEIAKGTITDNKGNFLLENICIGEYHLIFSHIGCESKKIHLEFTKDTIINIRLSHTPASLGTVVIEGKKDELINQPNLSVNRQTIEDNTNQNLSGLLENETGVSLIKNGSGISKPVVHGLYGNRLTILNNGIVQSGQQWGNDHSPEIDPFAADKIIVLKGVSAIEYGGGNLGRVILVEPKRVEREPHLHGQINYVFETNGRGHSLNTRLEKYSAALAWRINGTLKKYGDKKTADYFLNNTGIEEANFSIQLEKSWKDKLFFDFYASTFNTRLGILRGSHIGNLTDLEQALTNEVPFFTEPGFSYSVDAPKQNVSHHLAKGKAKYFIKNNQIIEFVIASQINNRKEFDVRRSGRTDIPALSLTQYAFNSELKYTNNFGENWNLKFGNQNIVTDNTNNPETGILPLIPDYISWESGLFGTLSKRKNKTRFNMGIRYDYEHQNVVTISNSIPREIIRFENQFHNISGLFAIKLDVSKTHSISMNTGYAMRNPAINELYSNGLHQGVSGIEEGDISLNTEKAINSTLEYKWFPGTKFSLSTLIYHQHFKDYIFLNPQDEIRLTIRGAFPVFRYEQTDANIYGLDISTQFTIGNSLFGILKYSYLRGEDTQNNEPLVFIPPNSFFGSLTYRAKKPIKLSKNLIMEEPEIEINNRLVLEQKNILQEQDFVQPPPTYNLFGLKMSSNIVFSNYKMRCFVKADNLFNTRYRDYLNRQRYFADDIGRSITFGINFKF